MPCFVGKGIESILSLVDLHRLQAHPPHVIIGSDSDPIWEEFTIAFDMNIQSSKTLMVDNLNSHVIDKISISMNFKLSWRKKS